eukprot:1586149-Pyramimonas_sp.AAC.1
MFRKTSAGNTRHRYRQVRTAREALKGRGKSNKAAPPRRPAKLQNWVDQSQKASQCWGCGETVHWTGDEERPAPGARKFAPKDGESKG